MIQTLLQKAQDLISKDFLLSTIFPCLIWTAALVYIFGGLHKVIAYSVAGLSGAPTASLQLVAVLVFVYMVSYVLFGIRSTIHRLFEGQWPFPLSLIARLMERWTYCNYARAKRKKDQALFLMDVADWACQGFGNAYCEERPSARMARWDMLVVDNACKSFDRPFLGAKLYFWSLPALFRLRTLVGSPDSPGDGPIAAACLAYKNAMQRVFRQKLNERLVWAKARYQRAANEFLRYPRPDRLRATRLGTVVSEYESYSNERYGIDMATLYPRLLFVLDDKVQNRLGAAETYLDFAILSSFLAAIIAILPVPLLSQLFRYAVFQNDNAVKGLIQRFADVPIGQHPAVIMVSALLVAMVFYELAVISVNSYGYLVCAVVDLNRSKVLDALEVERGASYAAEKVIWTGIKQFVILGENPDSRVTKKAPK